MKGGRRAAILRRLIACPGATLRFEGKADRAAVDALAAAGLVRIVEQAPAPEFRGGIYAKAVAP
jgi:hypothetical protein